MSPLPPRAVRLLEHLLAGRPGLLAQLPHTTLGATCRCGCVCVDLEVDTAAVAPCRVAQDLAADASFPHEGTPDLGGCMVWVSEGYLSYLEVYSLGEGPVTDWPDPSSVHW